MLKYFEYRKVMELKEKGVKQCHVAKQTGFTLHSVRRVWDMIEEEYLTSAKYTHEQMDEFRDDVLELLRAYPTMRNATVLDRIREKYPDREISHSTFYRYMVNLREQEGFVKNGRVFTARVEPEAGYEAQVDMGQTRLKDMYGAEIKVYFFCMVLSYSRMKYAFFSVDPFSALSFIYAHEKAFKYFGGRMETIVYDQDRVMVISENAGNVVYTKVFDEYRQKAGFKVWLCRRQDPDSKGRIENVVKFIKTSFSQHREYCGIDSLNSACLAWLDRTGNGLVNANTRRTPRELFELESLKLIKHTPQNIQLYKQKIVSVSDLNTITYLKNKYDLPAGKYAQGARLRVEDDGNNLSIIDPTTNEAVVQHKLSDKIGQVVKEEKVKKVSIIAEKTKALFKQEKAVCELIDRIENDKPRYLTEQCRLLRKLHKQYKPEDILSAVKECIEREKFDVTEVLALLVAKFGIEKAENVVPIRTKKFYAEKAKGLAKYSALTEV